MNEIEKWRPGRCLLSRKGDFQHPRFVVRASPPSPPSPSYAPQTFSAFSATDIAKIPIGLAAITRFSVKELWISADFLMTI